jgi:5'-nucleotidase
MMKQSVLLFFLSIFFLSSCTTTQPSVTQAPPFEITILHLNDVYEIAPLEGGKTGGLARVASVKKDLVSENPNTIAVLAGDFLSPSLIGTLKKENGERIAGQQMIETLNEMGLDYATFGNHEFDLPSGSLLQKRIDQSTFEWAVCNAYRADQGNKEVFTQMVNGERQPIPKYIIREFTDAAGRKIRVGIIGVLLPFNKADYVAYDPVTESFRQTYEAIKGQTDFVVALTHLNVEDDLKLAAEVPGVLLFMGGHDHVNMNHYVEETIIAKADANAKSAYVHRISYHPVSKVAKVRSSLMPITDKITGDPATEKVVARWQNQVDAIMESQGYQPSEEVMYAETPLECKEVDIRSRPTNFGALTVQAMSAAWPGASLSVINSGSMRLDDNIQGTVTQYDLLRTFPFGGGIVKMELPGNVLQKLLEVGTFTNLGSGGYLQIHRATRVNGQWMLEDEPISAVKQYEVILPKFVAMGKEDNLEFLADFKFEESASFTMDGKTVHNDIRDIVIAYMKSLDSGK